MWHQVKKEKEQERVTSDPRPAETKKKGVRNKRKENKRSNLVRFVVEII